MKRALVAIMLALSVLMVPLSASAHSAVGHSHFTQALPAGTGNALWGDYFTTNQRTNITVALSVNTRDVSIRVRFCNGQNGSWLTIAANDHTTKTLATNVLDNTCFRLEAGAVGLSGTTITGVTNY